jgi:hypothetical protein
MPKAIIRTGTAPEGEPCHSVGFEVRHPNKSKHQCEGPEDITAAYLEVVVSEASTPLSSKASTNSASPSSLWRYP